MIQFAIISCKAGWPAWKEGGACGTDFVKLTMMAHMGSMLVLSSDFFIKRCVYIPVRNNDRATTSPQPTLLYRYILRQTAAQFHGNARLGPTGAATVFLPRHFREASLRFVCLVFALAACGWRGSRDSIRV